MSMRSAVRDSITKEARRAGWISAVASILLGSVCYPLAAPSRSAMFFVFYPLLPLLLGAVAVGALNFRVWHGFAESLAACFLAVTDVYKITGAMVAIYLAFSIIFGPIFLYLLAFVIYGSIYYAVYILLSFVIAVPTACAGGAALYGLLRVMRYLGEIGRADAKAKEDVPRNLRLVV